MSQSDSSDKTIPDSTYPVLTPPGEFKSQIPEHLLEDASPQDKHIMHELSVGGQYDKWLVDALIQTHFQVRRTNGRLLRAESDIKELQDDKKSLLQGWKLIAAIGMGLSGFLAFAIQLYKTFTGQ